MLPSLPGLRPLRAPRHLSDRAGPRGEGGRADLGPVEDAREGQTDRDPLREMGPHRLHQVAREHILHRAEFGEFARPLGLAHRQVGARVPALQHRLRAWREAVGDKLDRQIRLPNVGQRLGRVAQQGVVGIRPIRDRQDRRDGEADRIAGMGEGPHGGEPVGERRGAALVMRRRGGVDRETSSRAAVMR
ncbi:hypothetical protein PUR21_17090 [Methylorubrum rhodesianum]|uniref:Uncharacterized protein n=1 Tax=Methylorubrum rhodesianum TaxID=29427 RepID=A0ABU9ZDE9_9HYPH